MSQLTCQRKAVVTSSLIGLFYRIKLIVWTDGGVKLSTESVKLNKAAIYDGIQ